MYAVIMMSLHRLEWRVNTAYTIQIVRYSYVHEALYCGLKAVIIVSTYYLTDHCAYV